jgi:hypothetical protein
MANKGTSGNIRTTINGQPRSVMPWDFLQKGNSPWHGGALNIYAAALGMAQKNHNRNVGRYEAQRRNQPYNEIDPVIRRREAQQDAARLDQLQVAYAQLCGASFEATQKLDPYPVENTPPQIAIRTELRALLRAADDRKRSEMLQDPDFMRAALEAPGALSGLSADAKAHMKERVCYERFPEQMAARDAFKEAADLVRQSLDIARESIEHESRYVGVERAEDVPQPWVSIDDNK